MASSTEEVSVAPGDTTNDRTADDMTSSEKQFAVFKDFDFLEYELESQGVSGEFLSLRYCLLCSRYPLFNFYVLGASFLPDSCT